MNDPLPVEVEGQVQRLLDALETESSAYVRLARDEAEVTANWKLARSSTVTMSDAKSADKREAEAMLEHQALYRGYEMAKGRAEGSRQRMSALRSEIMAATSLNASMRELSRP